MLPDATRLGGVVLRVSDLARSLEFYEMVLGLRVIAQGAGEAVLGPHGDDTPLLTLRERAGAVPHPGRGRTGLYHFAILLPDRTALGRFVRHCLELGVHPGAGDHYVSEALYLQDPDNLGIEVYADRPRSTWRWQDGELAMGADAVDIRGLLHIAGNEPWAGMPAGTTMGHVHLQVGDIDRADGFYHGLLGFDVTLRSYPGARFFSAGGYHHHVGTNTWAGPRATAAPEDEAQLIEWTMRLPNSADVAELAHRLTSAGVDVQRDGASFVVADPWGIRARVR